jgi:hypothetical protein
MKSSYNNKIDFGDLIKTITFLKTPNKIVEFGILEGFSLTKFIENSDKKCVIEAFDLFDDFNGNHSNYDIINKFKKYDNVKIEKANLYEKLFEIEDNSVDILHVDIANNGDTYEFILKNGFDKLKKDGIIILEGGSVERDNIEWMLKYNKPKINPILKKYSDKYHIKTIGVMPSITIVKK